MKLVGISLIMITCTVLGFYIDAWQKERVAELEKLIYAFELLRGEIDYRLTPLVEACQIIRQMVGGSIGEIFESFSKQLEDKQVAEVRQMWDESIAQNKTDLHLQEEDYKVLGEFGNIVGHLDKEMQKKNIELLLIKLQKVRDEASDRYNRTSKMYKGIGILIGASISIVLI